MNLLITGGSGFIAGRLINHLSSKVNLIKVVTTKKNLGTSYPSNIKIHTIDWNNTVELDKICRDVDAVIHTAGMNSRDCFDYPELAIQFNSYKTLDLLNSSIKNKVKNFFFLSTAHVYSNNLNGNINEDKIPNNNHPYAKSNLLAEKFILNSLSKSEIKGKILRLSNIYGKPMNAKANCWELFIQNICYQAVINKEIILKTNGTQRRDFVPMRNLCFFLENIINKDDYLVSNIINIGTGNSNTLNEIARFVQSRTEKVCGYIPKIVVNKKDNNMANYSLNYYSKYDIFSSLELENNKYKEVDDLLKFCIKNFINKNMN